MRKNASIGSGSSSVIVDTNLLLLVVVGSADITLISRFKRTQAYTSADFDAIMRFLQRQDRIVVTPNIATETSNWIGQLKGIKHEAVWDTFCCLLAKADEKYVKTTETLDVAEASRLRVTDCAAILAAQDGHWVLTDDGPLHVALTSRNLRAIHLQEIAH